MLGLVMLAVSVTGKPQGEGYDYTPPENQMDYFPPRENIAEPAEADAPVEDYLPPVDNELPAEDYLPPSNEYLPP